MTASGSVPLHWAGYLLGFSLGGFFDGILLHQILQWHHLLSAVPGQGLRDIRMQVLADGLFHAAMYLVALAGLLLFWRSRNGLAAPGADRIVFAHSLIGFGAWHILDALLSHWLFGIHRIRMDSPNPLFWDLVWFVLFGLGPVLLGWLLRRRAGYEKSARGIASLIVMGATIAGATVSMRPPPNAGQVIVYFVPGTTAQQVFLAAAAADARIIGSDKSGTLWALDMADGSTFGTLYRHGALFVSGSILPAGCLSWSRLG